MTWNCQLLPYKGLAQEYEFRQFFATRIKILSRTTTHSKRALHVDIKSDSFIQLCLEQPFQKIHIAELSFSLVKNRLT